MTKQSIAIALALIVAVMPFLGFPSEMNDIYYTVAGVLIAALIHLSTIKYCHVCQDKIDKGEKDDEIKEEEDDYVEEDEVAVEDIEEDQPVVVESEVDDETQEESANKEELDEELKP